MTEVAFINKKMELPFWRGSLILCSVLCMSVAGPLAAQQIPATHTLKVNVDLVQVDVTVKDKTKHPLLGMTQDQFAVYEDNVKQEITYFGQDSVPLAIALVLDTAGCPPLNTYRHAVESARIALQSLKPEDRVALYTFDVGVQLVSPLSQPSEQLYDYIRNLQIKPPIFGSNVRQAVFDASVYLREQAPEARRAIILVSENYDAVRKIGDQELLQEMLKDDVSVYSIQLHEMEGAAADHALEGFRIFAHQLVEQTGGELFPTFDHTPEEVGNALQTIITDIKKRYTIGYYPANTVHDGKFHTITVKVKAQQWNPFAGKIQMIDAEGYVPGYAKRGYYATDPSKKNEGRKSPDNSWQ